MNGTSSIPVWTAKCRGNRTNCLYPGAHTAKDADSLKELVASDHTFICFKNCYRSEANFRYADTLVVDCDNTHSEEPAEWVTKEDIAAAFPGVDMAVYTSRSHMKEKDGRAPRPKYHVVFPVERITDPDTYKRLVKRVQEAYPYFDSKAQDAARFFYGNPDAEVWYRPGVINLSMFFDEDGFARMDGEIPEGSRNATMFKWAVRSMKRYGNTAESERAFYLQAERCVPPLEDEELAAIWRSAGKYYERIAGQPDYVPPEYYAPKGSVSWEEPLPFGRYRIMPFPLDALPGEIRDYAAALSESVQTPVDMAGCAVLSVIATCVQGKYVIEGKKDWVEPLNIYLTEIALPSERKSAIQHAVVKPVSEYENRYNTVNAAAVEASRMQRRILERRQKSVEDQAAKGTAGQSAVEEIARQLTEYKERKPLRLFADDITPEKLASVLYENGGRMALLSSEAGIFDTLAGAYSKSVNIDVMLKSYSGDQIRVDRIGRESENIIRPALTVLLMAQPNVISRVLGNETFRGRGLTARFLYCMPPTAVGGREYRSRPVPDGVYAAYERRIINMLEDEYSEKPEVMTLSPEADAMLEEFSRELEPKLLKEYAEIADWCGKLAGSVLRISGLLCRAGVCRGHDFLDRPEPLVVDGPTMAAAVRLGRYFLNHAQAVFNVLPENAMYENAKRVLRMITEKGLTEFNRRTAMRYCQSFKRVEEIQPVLDFLEDCGYIAQTEPVPSFGKGRPALPKYAVNPRIGSDYSHFDISPSYPSNDKRQSGKSP